MTKSMIMPFVSIFFLAIKGLFNIEVSDDLQGQVVDWITTGLFLVSAGLGIYRNHKIKEEKING